MTSSSSVTQCPYCRTAFHIGQLQLDAADGKVRCGGCLEIFNAREHFVVEQTHLFDAVADDTNIGTESKTSTGSDFDQQIEDISIDDFEDEIVEEGPVILGGYDPEAGRLISREDVRNLEATSENAIGSSTLGSEDTLSQENVEDILDINEKEIEELEANADTEEIVELDDPLDPEAREALLLDVLETVDTLETLDALKDLDDIDPDAPDLESEEATPFDEKPIYANDDYEPWMDAIDDNTEISFGDEGGSSPETPGNNLRDGVDENIEHIVEESSAEFTDSSETLASDQDSDISSVASGEGDEPTNENSSAENDEIPEETGSSAQHDEIIEFPIKKDASTIADRQATNVIEATDRFRDSEITESETAESQSTDSNNPAADEEIPKETAKSETDDLDPAPVDQPTILDELPIELAEPIAEEATSTEEDVSKPEIAAEARFEDLGEVDDEPSSDFFIDPEAGRRGFFSASNIAWAFGAIIMSLLLAAELLFFQPNFLRDKPWFQATTEKLCSALPCEHKPYRDISQLLVKGSIEPKSDVENVLTAYVTLQNTAAVPQSFPKIVVTLLDIRSLVTASRAFEPSEYLRGEVRSLTSIPSNRPIQLEIDMLNPGESSVGYEITLLP